MLICIPVTKDEGLASPVCAHFGSAPLFMLVDSETRACRALANRNAQHAHGMCQPLAALAGEPVEAVVVGGIGAGALGRLEAGGIRVFQAAEATVEGTVAALSAGSLRRITLDRTCGHQAGGRSGCAHD